MIKYLKLLLIPLTIVAAFMVVKAAIDKKGGDKDLYAATSRSEQWISKIDAMCSSDALSRSGYESISIAVVQDEKNHLINANDKKSLLKHLYSKSCFSLEEQSLALFRRDEYPKTEVDRLETLLEYLKSNILEPNESLSNSSRIFSEYHIVMSRINWKTFAKYSKPLMSFEDANNMIGTISSLSYYAKGCFHGQWVKGMIASLPSKRTEAERCYYLTLEEQIELNSDDIVNDYRSFADICPHGYRELIKKLFDYKENHKNK